MRHVDVQSVCLFDLLIQSGVIDSQCGGQSSQNSIIRLEGKRTDAVALGGPRSLRVRQSA